MLNISMLSVILVNVAAQIAPKNTIRRVDALTGNTNWR